MRKRPADSAGWKVKRETRAAAIPSVRRNKYNLAEAREGTAETRRERIGHSTMYAAASARLAIAKNSVAEKSRQLQTAASSRGTRRTFISSRSASLYARFNLYLRTLLGDGRIIASARIRARRKKRWM